MQMHLIKVDDEVYAYLKSKAEPFVDTTPNDVLRRALLHEKRETTKTTIFGDTKNNGLPELPSGTPIALEHILEVLYLMRKLDYTRTDATSRVATVHRIAPQTVLDKYCRQLNMKAYQFDKLLEQPDLKDLRAILQEKFKVHHKVIEDCLDSYTKT